jgi:hypothetical protein
MAFTVTIVQIVSWTSVNGDIGLEIGSIRVMRFFKRDGSFDDQVHNE